MQTESINNVNFKGDFIVLGRYSRQPEQCLEKVYPKIEKMLKSENYDLFVRQDFNSKKMNMSCGYIYPFGNSKEEKMVTFPVTSKPSEYINIAKKIINNQKSKSELNQQKKEGLVSKYVNEHPLFTKFISLLTPSIVLGPFWED